MITYKRTLVYSYNKDAQKTGSQKGYYCSRFYTHKQRIRLQSWRFLKMYKFLYILNEPEILCY